MYDQMYVPKSQWLQQEAGMYGQMYGVFDPHVMNEVVKLGDPMALSTPLLLPKKKNKKQGRKLEAVGRTS